MNNPFGMLTQDIREAVIKMAPQTIKEDSVQYQKVLETYLPHLEGTSPRVLSLGCAGFREIYAVCSFFGPNSDITGIDIDEGEIELGQKKFDHDAVPKTTTVRMLQGDCRDLGTLVNGEFPVILARHPDVFGDPWNKILKEAYQATEKNGVFLATCYTEEEGIALRGHAKAAGYNILYAAPNIQNTLSFSQTYGYLGFDGMIVVGKRDKESRLKRACRKVANIF